MQACFDRIRALLGLDIDIECCPHPAGPPVCWCENRCRGCYFSLLTATDFALDRSILVGRSPADRTLALRLGMTSHDASFLAS